VLAVAHLRGGGELGAHWHRAGKELHKKATFRDLLAAAGRLVELRYTSRQRLALWGRSAGEEEGTLAAAGAT
jgi:prolyl oligopeptidase